MAANPNSTTLLGRHGRLELAEVLAALIADGLLAAEDAKRIRATSRAGRGTVELHPLVVIASAKPENRADLGKPLTVESLTVWLADKAGLPYLKIDPMKIDAAAVTQAVSQAYAQRHRILPVAVAHGAVTFASAEPFETHWAADL